MESTYTTCQVARRIGIHPNTVRLYEALALISKPVRKSNGYRVFTELHLAQFELARTAFQIELLQKGLRKQIIDVVKLAANARYDDAIALTRLYVRTVREEMDNAKEAVAITKALLEGGSPANTVFLKRKDASDAVGITMDTLRNWEMNGLVEVGRKENGYRVYTNGDLQKLRIIRALRCANYSLSAILRMMNALNRNADADIARVLNMPEKSEEIVSVCDSLLLSLNLAEKNARQMVVMLLEMKTIYPS